MAGYTVSSVTSGKYARQITVSASGPQGAAGPAGAQGAQGEKGAPGGLSARFKFLNSYSATNPGGGYFAFNNATFMSATNLYVSSTDSLTDTQNALLSAMVQSNSTRKAVITLQKVSDPRKISRFYVTSGTDHSGWWTYQIEYIDGNILSWSYNEQVDILVVPIGNAGSVGPVGPTGPQGMGIPAGGIAGQVLKKSAGSDYVTEWVDPETLQDVSLSELTDVNTSTLADGQVLVYDQETSTWIPVSPESLPQSSGTLSGTIEGGSASSF